MPAEDPAAGPGWSDALAAVAALLWAGLSAEQMSRLADLRVRALRGGFAADGGPTAGAALRDGPPEATAGTGA